MADIKKYNLQGDAIGHLSLDDSLLQEVANTQMIKDYVVAYRANQRQWSANTKTRAEVCHSGKKPHPQKGTGRARQGYLGAPQYKGGGRVFGPRPKFDQHVKLNRKEKRAVIQSLLVQKIQAEKVHVLSTAGLEAPKTKSFVEFLRKLGLHGKRVLFLGQDILVAKNVLLDEAFEKIDRQAEAMASFEEAAEFLAAEEMKCCSAMEEEMEKEEYERFLVLRSLRNIPKVAFSNIPNLNGYDVILNQDIVLLDGPIDQLTTLLRGNK